MRGTKIILLLLLGYQLYGQGCPEYKRAIDKAEAAIKLDSFETALRNLQIAHIAARKCGVQDNELQQKYQELVEKLNLLRKKAISAEKKAIKSQQAVRASLEKEQEEKKNAERLKNLARAQAYAYAAYRFCERDVTMGVSFAFSSLKLHKNEMAEVALLKAFNMNSWFYSHNWEFVRDAQLSADGSRAAIIDEFGRVSIIHLKDKGVTYVPHSADHVDFLPKDNLLLWTPADSLNQNGNIIIIDSSGKLLVEHKLIFKHLVVSDDGNIYIAGKKASQDKNISCYIISGVSREVTTNSMPEQFTSVETLLVPARDYVIVMQQPACNAPVLLRPGKPAAKINVPNDYLVTGADVMGDSAAFYLKSQSLEYDALGILSLASLAVMDSAEIQIKTLELESKTSGLVRFIDSSTLIACSEQGSCQIYSMATAERFTIDGLREVDQVKVLPRDSLVIIARRSGEVLMYDYTGNWIAQLLGNNTSAPGLKNFRRLSVDAAGRQVLTVSRSFARIWQRPTYRLKFRSSPSDDAKNLPFATASPSDTLGDRPILHDIAKIDHDMRTQIYTSNNGLVYVQFELGSQADMFKTEFEVGTDSIVKTGMPDQSVFALEMSNGYRRYMAVIPDQVYKFMQYENERGRIVWNTPAANEKWVATDELKQKVEQGKIVPIAPGR